MSHKTTPPRTEGSNPSLSATTLPGKSRDTRDKTKPRTYLPDGSPNPEYRRWYRSTPEGRAQVKKWNNSAGGQKAQKKFKASKKTRQSKAKKQRSGMDGGAQHDADEGLDRVSLKPRARGWEHGCQGY